MANCCSNSVVVYGNKEEIDIFYQRCLSAKRMAEEKNQYFTYWLFVEHGYNEDEIIGDHPKVSYVGGNLDGLEEPAQDKDDWFIRFDMTTRWNPMTEGLHTIVNQYISLKFVFIADEPGADIYENSDTEGRWFPDRYLIDDWDNGYEYFADDLTLKNYLKETYGVDIENVSDLPDDYEVMDLTDPDGTEHHAMFHRFINPMQ